ncbi:hypothetical protein C6P74_23985 [Burkholderia multivorans]|nr:hypothetical protein C6P74_23985 [Burkholderia multivorans]
MLPWKWNQITNKENKSIKEVMNFLYQYNLVDDVFSPQAFRKHYGDFFIHDGYVQFNWTRGLIESYLPEIEKIETNLRLKKELTTNKTTITSSKL